MGNSPDDGWIQRVTIEIPGPVSDQETWTAYKEALHEVLDEFAGTIRAQVVQITNIKKPASTGGGGTEPDVTPGPP